MIKVVTEQKVLLEFKDVWNSIFEKDNTATPFQQFEYTWLSLSLALSSKNNLYIIFVKDDTSNTWIAIFPFLKSHAGKLQFINMKHTDFCSHIVLPEFNNYNLYETVAKYLISQKDIKAIKLDNITATNPLTAVFKSHFKYSICHDINYYSTIPIYTKVDDKDMIDSFRYVNAKQKRNLRKRRESTINCKFEICSKYKGKAYPKEIIESLTEQMINKGIRIKDYFSDTMLKFWENLYENGILHIALIFNNDKLHACNFMFYNKRQNEYIKWIVLYTEGRWNLTTNIKIAEYLYNNGGGKINFARGIYDYKLVNFHPDVKPLFCVKIAKTKWGHFKNIISTALHFSKPIIKPFLHR